MGTSEIEEPLLSDDMESQINTKVSRVNETYVPVSQSEEALGYAPQGRNRNRSVLLVVAICCIAATLFLTAAFVSNNSRFTGGGDSIRDGSNEFYKASHTGFHFQPEKNWMNDPNAPMFYMGYYHFFYQYNPEAAVWGNIAWGHSVSTDLIHWKHLEIALSPDQWYDIAGVFSGSATILQDGTPAIFYTGGRIGEDGVQIQTQCLAVPVDPSDPLLRKWKKIDGNPLLQHPDNVRSDNFRDPTTAWLEQDGSWRLTIGAERDNADGRRDGISLMYKSTDFIHWELQEKNLHEVLGSGMWECVDFFPISVQRTTASNHSGLGAENYLDSYKYVLKASMYDTQIDHYTLGTYSTETDTFSVDDPALDLGLGFRYDYGKFYASKTFFDSSTGRRILWGWVSESDTEQDDIVKGWASVQSIPRTLWLDGMTSKNLLQWPVEEVEGLRGAKASHQNIQLLPTDVLKVEGADGPQLDILVEFEKPDVSIADEMSSDVEGFDCIQGGAARRGVFGPFGLLVHADDALLEQTGIFFYVSRKDGEWVTRVCSDQSKSSLASDLDVPVYGGYVTVLPTDDVLSLRILLDHSIVETFAQGGRVVVTSRVYPTIALNSRSHVFLFNNGTTPIQVKSLDVYQMGTVEMNTI